MTGWRQWLWLPIWLVGGMFTSASLGSWRAVAALLVGVAVGAAWQVLARRDVADRLALLAAGTLALGLLVTVDGVISGNSDLSDGGGLVYLASVAAAVVLTEQVLRRRDLGSVTLDMVHAPEAGSSSRQHG